MIDYGGEKEDMKKKIVSMCLAMGLFFLIIPVGNTIPNEHCNIQPHGPIPQENLSLNHVVAKGNGTCLTFLGTFFLGIGWCAGMVVILEEDGYIEITPLDNSTNSTILEGSHQLFIVGFVGLRLNIPQVNVNGIALLTLYS
jgi:hypothetical protein